MPAPHHHPPALAIDDEAGAIHQAAIGSGHRLDVIAETAKTFARALHLLGAIARLLQVERTTPAEIIPLHPAEGEPAEILGLGHVKRHLPALAKPAGHTDMVGVIVGRQHCLDRLVAKTGGKHLLPQFLGLADGNAGIDQPPAICILQQVEIDVVQRHGQWHTQPLHTRYDLSQLAGSRHVVEQVLRFRRSALPAPRDPGPSTGR